MATFERTDAPPYLWMLVTEDECQTLKTNVVPASVQQAAVRLLDYALVAPDAGSLTIARQTPTVSRVGKRTTKRMRKPTGGNSPMPVRAGDDGSICSKS